MIEGFEDFTGELSEQEEAVAKILVDAFPKWYTGVERAVTNARICKGLKKEYSIDMDQPRIRKIISHLRIKRRIPNLLANSKGYYVENDPALVQAYIRSVRGRIDAMTALVKSLEVNFLTTSEPIQQKIF